MKLKRLLITVCSLLFCLCLGAAIAGCGDEAHTTHTGSDWKSDDTKHWKICTECGQKFAEASHSYVNGVCECGKKENTNPSGNENPGGNDNPSVELPKEYEGDDPNCEHEFPGGWVVARERTCTEDGVQSRTCPKCHRVEVRTLKSQGHTLVDRAGTRPTCTEPGSTDYKYCTVCGYSDQEELPALGHDLEEVPAEEASCTKVGWTKYQKCKRCDYNSLDDEEKPEDHYINMLPHNYPSEDPAAECTMCHKTRFKASEGLEIVVAGTIARVVGIGTCTDTVISIPEDYEGRPVTEISDYAFDASQPYNYSTLSESERREIDEKRERLNKVTEIKMRGILRINTSAFFYMTGLKSIDLGENLQRIGMQVFSMCTSLEEINIPKTCSYIDNDAFYRCDSLKTLTVDSENQNFMMLENKFLVAKLTGELKFVCMVLENAGTPNAVEKITIPAEVKSIGYHAFNFHWALQEITIPENVTSIGDSAFSGCRSLRKVVLEAGVKSIGTSAFSGCSALSEFIINVKEVTEVDPTTGDDVTKWSFQSIYQNCFAYCTNLEAITFNGTKEQWKTVQKFGDGLLNDELNFVKLPTGDTVTQRVYMKIKCTDGNLKENQEGAFIDSD